MRATILCPGPSLARAPRQDIYSADITIGVNRAATAFEVDWWAFFDACIYLNNRPIGAPNIYTSAISQRAIGDLKAPELMIGDTLMEFFPIRLGWTMYTATASLILAAHLGAKRIDVYGADWTADAEDFDGVYPDGAARSAFRFARESEVWLATTTHLESLGITTKRITLNG